MSFGLYASWPGSPGTLPELASQGYVGTVQSTAIYDNKIVDECLNLNIDMEMFGVEIAAYRIKWFSGKWSGWFVPGVNDLYKKDGEPLRRYWACFNDHEFEFIYESNERQTFPMLP